MSALRRSAAECVAMHFGADIQTIRDARYQPTRYRAPAVYAISDMYLCAPVHGQKRPLDFDWIYVATQYGRDVYRADTSL